MEKKKEMNLALASLICLVFAGILIFITLNGKANLNMDTNNESSASIGGAQNGDIVAMNYTGKLEDGTVFDSNVDPKFGHVQPFVFILGAGQVIPGWEKGIAGMKEGEKKTLTITPSDAYGEGGVPGVIPPNSTLIFDVELLQITRN